MSRPALVPEFYVSDIAASKAFYVDLLGFRVAYERPEERFAALELGRARLMLDEARSLSRATPEAFRIGEWRTAELVRPFGRGVNIEIEAHDVDAAAERIRAGGHPMLLAPHERSYRVGASQAVMRQLLVEDPDGYLVRLSQEIRRERKTDPVTIRDFDPTLDASAVRACFVELQDFERGLDPRMPSGDRVADAYLEQMFARCREFDGGVLVAGPPGAVVGFVTILSRYRSTEPDDDPGEHAFVTDLVVAQGHRGRGIGRALLRAAEARGREAGAPSIRLSVKATNHAARALYEAEGFEDSEVFLEKSLAPTGPPGDRS